MKLKVDSKSISTLKAPEQYRTWKHEVTMMVRALGVPSLLHPWSNQGVLFTTTQTHTTPIPTPTNPDTDDTTSQLDESSSSRPPTDISTHEGGKRRGKERGEDTEEFSQGEWNE
jgi:hypothetical protein